MKMRQLWALAVALTSCTQPAQDAPVSQVSPLCADICACDGDVVVCVGEEPQCQDDCACDPRGEMSCIVTQRRLDPL